MFPHSRKKPKTIIYAQAHGGPPHPPCGPGRGFPSLHLSGSEVLNFPHWSRPLLQADSSHQVSPKGIWVTDKSTGCHGYQLQEHIPPEGTLSLGWEGPGVRLSQGSSEPLEVILEGAVFSVPFLAEAPCTGLYQAVSSNVTLRLTCECDMPRSWLPR